MGSGYVFSDSIDESVVPNCVRTMLRAKILLSINQLQVCTLSNLVEVGFKKSTLQKFMKEFIAAGLVLQRHQLFKLTQRGKELALFLLTNEKLSRWIGNNFHDFSEDALTRPTITYIDHLSE